MKVRIQPATARAVVNPQPMSLGIFLSCSRKIQSRETQADLQGSVVDNMAGCRLHTTFSPTHLRPNKRWDLTLLTIFNFEPFSVLQEWPAACTFPWCMSIVNAACSCSCCISRSLLHIHVHVYAVRPCPSMPVSHSAAPCLLCMSMSMMRANVQAACSCLFCMSINKRISMAISFQWSCPCVCCMPMTMYILHAIAHDTCLRPCWRSFPCYRSMSMLHVHVHVHVHNACPLSMLYVHVHAAVHFYGHGYGNGHKQRHR